MRSLYFQKQSHFGHLDAGAGGGVEGGVCADGGVWVVGGWFCVCGAGGGVVDGFGDCCVGMVGVLPARISLINFIVEGPKTPVPFERPFGVRTYCAFASWNAIKAARVAGPKLPVSFPGEPRPVEAMINPCEFKNFWSASTSPAEAPPAPSRRLRVKENFPPVPVPVPVLGVAAVATEKLHAADVPPEGVPPPPEVCLTTQAPWDNLYPELQRMLQEGVAL